MCYQLSELPGTLAKEQQRDSQKLLMALSEKESEGEKQTGWEREQDLDPKEGEVMQKIKKGVGGQERLNDADSAASLPVNLSPCGSHSSVHSSLKEIPLKTACA